MGRIDGAPPIACHTSWVSRNCVRTHSTHFACADSDPSYTDAQCADTTGLIQIPQVWMQKTHDLGVARRNGIKSALPKDSSRRAVRVTELLGPGQKPEMICGRRACSVLTGSAPRRLLALLGSVVVSDRELHESTHCRMQVAGATANSLEFFANVTAAVGGSRSPCRHSRSTFRRSAWRMNSLPRSA